MTSLSNPQDSQPGLAVGKSPVNPKIGRPLHNSNEKKHIVQRIEVHRNKKGLVHFFGQFSASREVSDGDDHDEGIAAAIAEEESIVRWGLADGRKLTEKVIRP